MSTYSIASRALAATAVLAVAAGLWAGAASAQQPMEGASPGSSFGIRAGEHGRTTLEDDHFTYDVPAGTSVEDSIILVNHTDRPLELRLYPADLISADGGGFAPAQPDVASKGVGAWALLDRSAVVLAPSATEEVAFRLDVPDNTTPGEYPGAIVASTVAGRAATGLAVETRAALIAKVRVPGALVPKLDVGPLTVEADDGSGRTFSVTVSNPGNVLLEVPGEVLVDSGGERLARLRLSPTDTYVIPGGETTLTARWQDPPMMDRVVAQAVVAARLDGETIDTYRSEPLAFLLFPWLIAVATLAIIALVSLLWLVIRRRRRNRREERRQHVELLEEVSQLRAERGAPVAASGEVNRPRRAEAPRPRRRMPPARSDPRAHRG